MSLLVSNKDDEVIDVSIALAKNVGYFLLGVVELEVNFLHMRVSTADQGEAKKEKSNGNRNLKNWFNLKQ